MRLFYWSLIVCSFLLSTQEIHGQSQFNGKVVDEQGNPVEYATIFIKSQACGTHSAADGSFEFMCSDAITATDTLMISYLGYASINTPIGNYRSNGNYVLKISNINLNVIAITGSKDVKMDNYLFKYKYNNPFFYYQKDIETNYQLASRIRNKDNISGLISSIEFKTGFAGVAKIPIRLMFYDVNEECNCPGEPLHQKDIIVNIKKGKNKFSIRDSYVEIPERDYYIAFEWLHQNGRNVKDLDFSIGMIPYNSTNPMLEKVGDSDWKKVENLNAARILTKIKVEWEVD